MKYCTECGGELTKGYQFCVACGHPVKTSSLQGDGTRERKKFTKKQKIWTVTVVLLFVVLGSAYIIGANMTSKKSLVQEYEEAVEKKDAAALAELFVYEGVKEKVEKSDTKAYLEYLKSYPDKKEEVLEELEAQLPESKSGKQEFWDEMLAEDPFLEIVKDGKFLVFDRYKLAVSPVYATFQLDYQGTRVKLGEKEIFTSSEESQEQKYGPLFPGIYTFTASYRGETAELKTTETAEFWQPQDYLIHFNMEADTVRFQTDMRPPENRTLFIDGKKVDFDPFGIKEYGPIVLDGATSAEVEAEFPWGKMKSGSITLEEPVVDVSFQFTKKLDKKLAEIVRGYFESYLVSFEKQGKSGLKNATTEWEEIMKDELATEKSAGYTYAWKVKEMEMLAGEKEISEAEGNYHIRIPVRMEYYNQSYEAGSDADMDMSKDTMDIHVIFLDGKWQVYDVTTSSLGYEEFPETIPVLSDTKEYKITIPEEKNTSVSNELPDYADPAAFVIAFREAYEQALNAVDFSIAENFLLYDSSAYHDLKTYMETDVIDTFEFNFTVNEPLAVEDTAEGISVHMHEQFIFTHEGERTDYDREKLYHLIVDENGDLKISRIDILDTVRE
ncbi:zinc ribbon domain-containing protein [Thalassobacillus pellis]|uniref:zinc ribbon domain-containing protein n=1 Tax=Thalassobacillus pellis TaxID=748008 RepID=UPI00195FD2DF|nr:hypothetical protein [Thalassobacillus pellis]MBM7551622.1 putative membrane protein YvbJ [Thalassobacillus pellis]